MQLKLYRAAPMFFGAFSLILCIAVGSLRAQQTMRAGTSEEMRSAAFNSPFEDGVEQSLEEFRAKKNISLSNEELRELQISNREDFGLDEQLLSLDLFRSLAAYIRGRHWDQQACVDDILSNATATSSLAPKAVLLGALEFYCHSPLRRID